MLAERGHWMRRHKADSSFSPRGGLGPVRSLLRTGILAMQSGVRGTRVLEPHTAGVRRSTLTSNRARRPELVHGPLVDAGCAAIGAHPFPGSPQVRAVRHPRHEVFVQGRLRGAAPAVDSPGRVQRRCRAGRGSSLTHRVRPSAPDSCESGCLRPLLTSARSRAGLLPSALTGLLLGPEAFPARKASGCPG